MRAAEEDAILNRQGVKIAGTHANDRSLGPRRLGYVCLPRTAQSQYFEHCCSWRKQERLEGMRPNNVIEVAGILDNRKPILPGLLLIPNAQRQFGQG